MNSKIFIDNSILLIPNNIKNKVLLELNKLNKIYNIKIMSLENFIKNITFSYDEKTIVYLIDNYNINYDMALDYLNNLKYISFNKKNTDKLNELLKIKEDLENKNLLIYDNLFETLIKNKKIVVYGYDYISKYDLNILKKCNAIIIEKENYNYTHDIYEFNNISDEVQFVAGKIIDLINKNIDINKIKLCNINDEYNFILSKIFSMYNLNINLNDSSSIYSTNIAKDFFLYLNEDINVTLDMLKKKYNFDKPENHEIYKSIINILNKYYFIDNYKLYKDLLIHEFKNQKLKKINYKNSIELVDLNNNVFEDDEYIFLLGFNQTIIPKIYKDEEYISDREKQILNIETSLQKNKIEKEIVIKNIKNIKNLIITYKLNTPFNSYYPSTIIEELNYCVIKNPKMKYNYSNLSNKINLSKKLDNYVKYGEIDEDLNLLYSSYEDIDFMSFDNKFNGINKNNLPKFIKDKLILSYTSMDNYYSCSFKYYLKNILKLEEYEETFAAFIGSLFHYILSKCFFPDFNFDLEFNNYIKNKNLNFKEKFYIKKLKEDLIFIINTIKKQYMHMNFDKALYEDEIFVNYDKSVKVTFKGYIDKILYKECNDYTYAVIIDYKTGNPDINLNNMIYGLNMQLPIYLYLTKNNKKLKNVKILGFYLQKILNKPKDEEKRENSLKLQGYSIDNENLLEIVDDTYENSEIIESLKKKKDGTYSTYSKVISEDEIDKINSLTGKKIEEAIDDILNCKFDINPKKSDKKIYGCEYCKFKDICYRTNNDIVTLKEYNNLDFID